MQAAKAPVLFWSLFTLTGFASALFGAALPALLLHWSLRDAGAGFLFFMAWLGSALGAALSRGDMRLSVARGAGLAGVSALGLAHARGGLVFALALLYGLGLGIAMTSTSLLRAGAAGPRRTQELNRLNLLWALGALSSPVLAEHALRTARPSYLFTALGISLLVFAGLALLTRQAEQMHRALDPRPHAPLLLCAASALIVGTECSLSGWLTTFSRRADGSIAGAVGTATAFWAGLLLSRALHSTPWLGRAASLRPYTAVLAAALLLLAASHGAAVLVVIAFALGAVLGPLYPLLLALATARYSGSRAFLAAGLGAALFPWLTGVVSQLLQSLRAGLLVPCAAALVLLLLTFRTENVRVPAS